MKIEYEATFTKVDKNEIREKLKLVGAQLIKSEFLMKRTVFNLPAGHEINGGWLRVRDEGDKITMSLKIVNAGKVEDQKETCLVVNDYNESILFLKEIGCREKSYQETKRELWFLDDVEITIDEWPFLEPFVEIEGNSEEAIKMVSKKLSFNYSQALFCAVDTLYSMKYGIPEEFVDKVPLIIFNNNNPFIK